uniref:non-specific serine/threonine protein kinase n=1 Tax=Cyanistes caeruleus TaxID=156563 RepID=A0A8C0U6M1_CYACU
LKEISVGNLKPNETVEANLEAQLLSKLDHPAIVKFYASFVERDSFCIITEYCEIRSVTCSCETHRQTTEEEIGNFTCKIIWDYKCHKKGLNADTLPGLWETQKDCTTCV